MNASYGAEEVSDMVKNGLFDDGTVYAVEIGNEPDAYIITYTSDNMDFYPSYQRNFDEYV